MAAWVPAAGNWVVLSIESSAPDESSKGVRRESRLAARFRLSADRW